MTNVKAIISLLIFVGVIYFMGCDAPPSLSPEAVPTPSQTQISSLQKIVLSPNQELISISDTNEGIWITIKEKNTDNITYYHKLIRFEFNSDNAVVVRNLIIETNKDTSMRDPVILPNSVPSEKN